MMFRYRIEKMSRRAFLRTSGAAGAGLMLAVYGPARAAEADPAAPASEPRMCRRRSTRNAFVRIGADNTVTVISKHLEMGQGTYTGLATLVAEELDCAWSQVKVEGAPAEVPRYANKFWGPAQGTGGSTAIANSFEQYRQAGAAARAMLVAAAAKQWKVAPESIVVKSGVLTHSSGKRATFGQLAAAAAIDARADDGEAEGCEGFHADRQERAAQGFAREIDGQPRSSRRT